MKQRDLSLDLLRIMACVMVVTMHSPLPTESANGLLLSSLSYFTAPCIGLFFMVSGALILPPSTVISEGSEALPFLRKRLKRVLMPTLVWTLFYLVVKVLNGQMTSSQILKSVVSVPFSAQGHGVLWFMYTLMGLYLIAPILHAWLRSVSVRELNFYLLLWLVTMTYPLLQLFVDVNTTPTGILYYCSGYVGYFLLGYWMQRFGDQLSLRTISLLMFVSVAAPVAVKLMHITVDFYSMFWYLSIFVAVQCVFWWKIMKCLAKVCRFSERVKNGIVIFSNLSFGIYLSHIFLMRHLIWNIPFVAQIPSQILQIVVVALLTLMFSLIVSLAFSMTSLGNAVVGWRKR